MFKEELQRYATLIEDFLNTLPWQKNVLAESMRYSLAGGGKRIRPVLALAAAEMNGGDPKKVLPSAAALELIHTYSLIHDDLPAMDDDDYRRGRLSNHKVFGEGTAILAGDALLTYAFELLSLPADVAPELQVRVLREVAEAAGPRGMVYGQVLDLEGEGTSLSLAEIERIHRHKTGAMLMVSARLGGILAGSDELRLAALTEYAGALGLAFQIKDDILDVEGESEILGKPVGSDQKRGKATYPSLLGLAGARAHLQSQVDQAKASLRLFGQRGEFLRDLADFIAERRR
ncbi:polyprenyl synthetase family protein [Acididesulfobacillus acetoxydans]|uniref:polyprenyl synthetase family protein n=1 Tax=Acididesulfobacillus acetoxydans TaxID=1561005 RepID=UPI001F0EA29B|nr:farnesyl diphosphate synthase [Acididesulfobacillus acetoxydans]